MGNENQALFFGRGHTGIDDRILQLLTKEGLNPNIHSAKFSEFGNTEIMVDIPDSVRGKAVIICQDYDKEKLPRSQRFGSTLSINDILMETFIFAEAAKGSKALEIYFVLPELPYETSLIAGLLHTMRGAMWYEIRENHDSFNRNDLRELGDWIHKREKSSYLKPGKILEPIIYIGSAATDIGERIGKALNANYDNKINIIPPIATFADVTKSINIDETRLNVSGKDVFFIQNFYQPNSGKSANDYLIEALLFAYYARKNDAGRITAVFPNFPYERQDKRQRREPISIKVVAELLYAAKYDEVLTVSLHCEESEGTFGRLYFDNIKAAPIIYSMIHESATYDKRCILTTDMGGAELGRDVTRMLREQNIDARLAIGGKNRPRAEQVGESYIVGNESLPDRHISLVDDLIASGGSAINTSSKAYSLINEAGKRFGGLSLYFVSGFFNNGALEKLKELHDKGIVGHVYVTNTIPHDYISLNRQYPFLHVFDISKQIAKSIQQINTHGSISETLEKIEHIDRIV
jgi:ribose-phosphate pyrophosphokinase